MITYTESSSFNLREAFGYQTPIQASESTAMSVTLHQCFRYKPPQRQRYWIYSAYSVFDGYNLIAHLVDLIWHVCDQTV